MAGWTFNQENRVWTDPPTRSVYVKGLGAVDPDGNVYSQGKRMGAETLSPEQAPLVQRAKAQASKVFAGQSAEVAASPRMIPAYAARPSASQSPVDEFSKLRAAMLG